MVISASKLHMIDPEDDPSQSRPESPTENHHAEADDSDDDKASLTFEDYKRQNRFQLAPEGVSRLLTEAGAAVQGRVKSGLTSGYHTPRSTEKGARFGEMREFVDEKQEIMGGFDGLGRILRGDVGYAMRCKAEEGYGLSSVRPAVWFTVTWLIQVATPQCCHSNSLHRARSSRRSLGVLGS